MNKLKSPPHGQALIEVLLVGSLLVGCLALLAAGQEWAEQRAKSAEAIRLHAEWCRQSLQQCRSEDIQALLPAGATLSGHVIQQQHANATTLKDWAASLRSFAALGGQKIFGLPDGSPLTLVEAQIRLPEVGLFGKSLPETLRLAMVPHDWRSVSASEGANRVRHGSEPSDALIAAVSAAHAPSISVLMPLTDMLGLDMHTSSIRQSFHKLDPLRPAQALAEHHP
ncbi:MAG: hypothetical protein RL133_1238 [Pseudomonadota bacterium]